MYRNVHPVFEAAIKRICICEAGTGFFWNVYTEMRN